MDNGAISKASLKCHSCLFVCISLHLVASLFAPVHESEAFVLWNIYHINVMHVVDFE